MSYSDRPKFLCGCALEMAAYILNSFPTKSAPNTLVELWIGHKASKQHYRIKECQVYVLKENIRKLDTKSELCYFVGYPKGFKGILFYDSREQIVLVSTNTIFLEEDYMIDLKPNDRFELSELSNTPRELLEESCNPM